MKTRKVSKVGRRDFVFGSLKAALLLTPVLSLRDAKAAAVPKRVVFWVSGGGYPDPGAFFPTGTEKSFQLSPILAGLESLKGDMVIVDGVNLRDSGLNPKGNNHIRCPEK